MTNAFNLYDYNDRSEVTESARYLGADTSDTSSPVLPEFRSYDYDPIGNRKQTVEGADTETYTSNALNQYTQQDLPEGATNSYTYDLDGNLTEISEGTTTTEYQYNGENRLITVQPNNPVNGDNKVEFTYDYMGRRIQKIVSVFDSGAWSTDSEKRFVYNGWNLIGELTVGESQSIEKYYVWGLDLSQTMQGAGGVGGLMASVDILAGDFDGDGVVDGTDLAELANNQDLMDLSIFSTNFGKESSSSSSGSNYVHHYYFYDGNGNVGQLVESGNNDIVAHYEYDAFGNQIVASGPLAQSTHYRFSTKYIHDEFSLYDYGLRPYDPETGRWISRDPVGEDGGLNLYGFVVNAPVDLVDSLGLDFIAVGSRAVTGTGGFLGFNHMSVYFFKEDPPCTKEGHKFDYNQIPKTATQAGFYELLKRADLYERVYRIKRRRLSTAVEEIAVSVIYDSLYSKSMNAERLIVIFSDIDQLNPQAKIAEKGWERIKLVAKNYEYALQSNNIPKTLDSSNWPKVRYIAATNATNSNTFVRFLVRSIARDADVLGKGKHYGAQHPSTPEDKFLKSRGYPTLK